MNASKRASRRVLKPNLVSVDAHAIQAAEYQTLPEVDDDLLGRAVVNKGGRLQPNEGERPPGAPEETS